MDRKRIRYLSQLAMVLACACASVLGFRQPDLAGAQAAATALPPMATPTSLARPAPADSVSVNLTLGSGSIVPGDRRSVSISVQGHLTPECFGIPGQVVDLMLVIDNANRTSSSGSSASLDHTRLLLLDFVTQADQNLFVRPDYVRLAPRHSRIGVVTFSHANQGTKIAIEGLTDDFATVRNSIRSVAPGSVLPLADSIQAAIGALQSAKRAEATPTILLAMQDVVPFDTQTIAAIKEARQEGIQVYILEDSLNVPADAVMTQQIAQTGIDANDFIADPSTAALRGVFVQMSGGHRDWIARDIAVSATWLPPGSISVAQSPADSLSVTGQLQAWQVDQLAGGQEKHLNYELQVRPDLSGVNQIIANVSVGYFDCNGYPHMWTSVYEYPVRSAVASSPNEGTAVGGVTPSSPGGLGLPTALPQIGPSNPPNIAGPFSWPPFQSILNAMAGVVPAIGSLTGLDPIMQWILLAVAALVLILLVWLVIRYLLYRRSRKEQPPPMPPKPIETTPAPSIDNVPAWLKRLTVERALQATSEAADVTTGIRQTVIIGVGPAGRVVLSQISSFLSARFGPNGSNYVRLLQIDVQPHGSATQLSAPRGLTPAQWIVLKPDLAEVQANLAKSNDAENDPWSHWRWYQRTAPSYDRARGRMAFFYDVKDGRENSALWRGIEKTFQGLDSPAVRVVATTFDDTSSGMLVDLVNLVQIIQGRSLNVQLWLAGPVGVPWSERLPDLKMGLQPNEQERRTLATLRELERFQRNLPIRYQYVPATSKQSELKQPYGMAVIQDLFVFQPKDTQKRAPEDDVLARMADILLTLLDANADHAVATHLSRSKTSHLVSSGSGVVAGMGSYSVRLPVGQLQQVMAWRMVRDGLFEAAIGLVPTEECQVASGEYVSIGDAKPPALGGPTKSALREDIEAFVDHNAGRWDTAAFGKALGARLANILNGEELSQEPTIARRDSLSRAKVWLDVLSTILSMNGASGIASRVKELRGQIEEVWLKWMTDEVYVRCQAQYDSAHNTLLGLNNQPARYWAVESNVEWDVYRALVRPWNKSPSHNVSQEPLLRFAQRFGWQVQFEPDKFRWQVRLLRPPGDFSWPTAPDAAASVNLEAFATKRSPDDLLEKLLELAMPLAQAKSRSTVAAVARALDPTAWLANSQPMIGYNKAEASALTGSVNTLTILAAQAKEQDAAAEYLEGQLKQKTGSLVPCPTKDPLVVSLVSVVDWLPLSTTRLYNAEAWARHPVPSNTYVWPPEQEAAAIEADALEADAESLRPGRLSAAFMSWLAIDGELLRQFALALLYETIVAQADEWQLPAIGAVRGNSACQILNRLFNEQSRPTILKENRPSAIFGLSSAIIDRRTAAGDRYLYLSTRQEKLVPPLSSSADIRERDLARYLTFLVKLEQQTL